MIFLRFLNEFTSLMFFKTKRKRKCNLASRPLEQIGGSRTCPWPEPRTGEAAAGVSRRGEGSPAAGKWGNGKREARATRRCACRGRGRPGVGRAAEQWLTGGGELWRRRSGGPGRRQAGPGASRRHEEAIFGV